MREMVDCGKKKCDFYSYFKNGLFRATIMSFTIYVITCHNCMMHAENIKMSYGCI